MKKMKNRKIGGKSPTVSMKKPGGASGSRIVSAVIVSAVVGAVCFLSSATAAAAVMYALASPFEQAYLGYLAAAGFSSAVSAVVFSRRSGFSPVVSALICSLASVAVHAAATGLLAPQGTHRLPILLCAAIFPMVSGFLFGRIRKDRSDARRT
ncbi:MAG: hypothetical protein IJK23_04260 [Clostridia bacterium]|nr:hypothetical protein [Clostridia bacterium]